MSEARSLLLVGKVRPERKRSLTGMALAAELPLVAIEEPTQAIGWLDANDPGCLVVDAAVGRLDKVISKLRSKPNLVHVPVLALVSAPDDLWIEQYFGWGGDDVVQVDAGASLLERLRAVPREQPKPHARRKLVIGEPDKSRSDVVSRVFGLAGFDVSAATDRKSLESLIAQRQPSVVIVNSVLGEISELIIRTRQSGANATWVVLAARREFDGQQQSLASVPSCTVLGTQINPWQLLSRVNELARPEAAERRAEIRRQFGSFVLFRAAGSDEDDIGVAFNLSSRGMFVRTYAPVSSDDVWLEWRVPQDKTRVRLEGRVVWRQTSLMDPNRAASPLGFGVEFCDYLGGARKHLERALEVLDGGGRRSSAPAPAPAAQPVGRSRASGSEPTLSDSGASPGLVSAAVKSRNESASVPGAGTSAAPDRSGARPSTPPVATGSVASASTKASGIAAALPTAGVASPSAGARPSTPPITTGSVASATTKAGGVAAAAPSAGNAPTSVGARPSTPPSAVAPARLATKTKLGDRAAPSASASGAQPGTVVATAPGATKAVAASGGDSTQADRNTEGHPASTPSDGNSTVSDPRGAAEKSEAVDRALSQAMTKRAGAMDAQAVARAPAGVLPPRPVGSPPRPTRLVGPDAVASTVSMATTINVSEPETSELLVETKERRLDTLREAMAFDDVGENTDPDGARELIEESPSSSEPTEILASPVAMFGPTSDEPKHLPFHLGDDVPTVVTSSQRIAGGNAKSRAAPEEEPPSARVAEAFFSEEEHVTQQWHAQAAAASKSEELGAPRTTPRRRPVAIVIGAVAAAAIVAGVGLWLRASGAPSTTTGKMAPPVPSLVGTGTLDPGATAAPSAAPVPTANALGSSSVAESDAGGIPWARIDDGTPLDGFPPVEDPQGGNGRLLADRYGYLVVRFPEAAYLFSNNIAMGATNWKIAVPCGEKVLRIGVGEKPVTWLSNEARVQVECRGTTRVIFERLPGVVVAPGVSRPVAPGSVPARKSPGRSGDGVETTSASPVDSQPIGQKPEAKPEPKPPDGESGVVDTRE